MGIRLLHPDTVLNDGLKPFRNPPASAWDFLSGLMPVFCSSQPHRPRSRPGRPTTPTQRQPRCRPPDQPSQAGPAHRRALRKAGYQFPRYAPPRRDPALAEAVCRHALVAASPKADPRSTPTCARPDHVHETKDGDESLAPCDRAGGHPGRSDRLPRHRGGDGHRPLVATRRPQWHGDRWAGHCRGLAAECHRHRRHRGTAAGHAGRDRYFGRRPPPANPDDRPGVADAGATHPAPLRRHHGPAALVS